MTSMKRWLLAYYLPLAVIYIVMSVVYPMDPLTIARRHIGIDEARVMALSVAITMIVLWLLALYASWQMKNYSRSIREHPDGKALMTLATGLQVVALYLPLRSVLKIVLNYSANNHPSLETATNLVITYYSLVFPLIAYYFISRGAFELAALAKAKISLRARYILIAIFAAIGASFCYASSASKELTPSDWLIVTDYNIVPALRVATILIPYMFMWAVGLLASYEIILYQQNVKGIFYRQSMKLLAIGLSLEIGASIIIQFITTISSSLRSLPTAAVMLIAFSVLTLVGVSFVIIALGVRKLKRLEEV
jgi:hypothetical protein